MGIPFLTSCQVKSCMLCEHVNVLVFTYFNLLSLPKSYINLWQNTSTTQMYLRKFCKQVFTTFCSVGVPIFQICDGVYLKPKFIHHNSSNPMGFVFYLRTLKFSLFDGTVHWNITILFVAFKISAMLAFETNL